VTEIVDGGLRRWPIELDAAQATAAPILGYRAGIGVGNNPTSQVKQPWCDLHGLIDIDSFAYWRALDELLGTGKTKSLEVDSLELELTQNWPDRAIPATLADTLGSSAPVPAIKVVGGGVVALVWANGMVIDGPEPAITALALLFSNFSLKARKRLVYARPDPLQDALNWLPNEVRRRYVPRENEYLTDAQREYVGVQGQITAAKQSLLNRWAAEHPRPPFRRPPDK
jgi:hypothetical protein